MSKFDLFLAWARQAALAQGITADTFDRATAGIAPLPGIAGMNDNQPEFAKPVWSYLDSAASARRANDGKVMLTRYGPALDAVAAQSGVPKEILLAIWGMETDYGHDTGGFNLFAALATLAYDGPRAEYAKPEFLAALHIMQDQHYAVSDMKASWAGAFGQTQFMPSTFFKYATDGDSDGKIDLWASPADALASTAKLLAAEGWQSGKSSFYEVKLPGDFDYSLADLDETRKLADWSDMGVTTPSGARLPRSDDDGALYLAAGAHGPAFMLLPNFRVILKYNNAAFYALAVGMLADRMAGIAPVSAAWPRQERALSHDERTQFQTDLKSLGYDPGEPDGVLGRKTRTALRAWQKSKNLPADGFPTASLLTALDTAAAKAN